MPSMLQAQSRFLYVAQDSFYRFVLLHAPKFKDTTSSEEAIVAGSWQSLLLLPRDLTMEEQAKITAHNFDHPNAFAWGEMTATLRELKAGRSSFIPRYDFVTSSRLPESIPVESADVILFEGILAFYSAGSHAYLVESKCMSHCRAASRAGSQQHAGSQQLPLQAPGW